ncbi:MAG: CHRD domain-containing protein [Rhodospirillales bacterium]|nr:CHRD domain-containing protein [Rhodospirillales bacterium]
MRSILTVAAFSLATLASAGDLAAAATREFSANLVQIREVVGTDTRGRAEFRLNADASALRYSLTAENIVAFTQAHIHLAPEALMEETLTSRFREPSSKDEHGPIVVFLTDFKRNGISVDGVLAEGVITKSDLVGPLRGAPLGLLAEFMAREEAYVALHVLQQMGLGNVFCCPVGLRGDIQIKGAP